MTKKQEKIYLDSVNKLLREYYRSIDALVYDMYDIGMTKKDITTILVRDLKWGIKDYFKSI